MNALNKNKTTFLGKKFIDLGETPDGTGAYGLLRFRTKAAAESFLKKAENHDSVSKVNFRGEYYDDSYAASGPEWHLGRITKPYSDNGHRFFEARIIIYT